MAELMVRIMYLIWRANNMFGRCAGKLKRLDGVWLWWCPFFFLFLFPFLHLHIGITARAT